MASVLKRVACKTQFYFPTFDLIFWVQVFYFFFFSFFRSVQKHAAVFRAWVRTRPVAPQHASRASSISTSIPSSWLRVRAAKAPEIPDPIITTSALEGSTAVVR